MERLLANRTMLLAVAAGFAAGGLPAVTPAEAQETGRLRVLVPALEAQEGASARWGRNVADDVRDHIDQMGTHESVGSRELRDALRQYRISERDLDCTTARQLAAQMGVQIVMCGEYRDAADGMHVAARFINTTLGDVFELEPFVERRDRDAAQRIFGQFEGFVTQLRLTSACMDYANSEQWEDAVRVCSDVLADNPTLREALYTRGRALMELDELEAALADMERLLEVDPVHEDGLMAAGILNARLNRQAEARRYFDEYLMLNPGNVHVRLTVATEAAHEGDPEGALAIALEGLEQEPDNLDLHLYAGHFAIRAAEQIARAQGANASGERSPEAVRYFEQALRHYSTVFDAQGDEADEQMLGNMIATLSQLGRHDEAAELGERVVDAKPDNAQLWARYADVLQRAGKLDGALAALDRVEQLEPEFSNLAFRRANWMIQSGRLDDRTRAAIRGAIQAGVEADGLARNVFVYGFNERYRRDRRDEALAYFQYARELATEAHTRAMAAFWHGFIIYQRAERIAEPQTPQAAERSLPLFREALQLFEQSGPYANQEATINLADIVERARTNIEIQELILRHRR